MAQIPNPDNYEDWRAWAKTLVSSTLEEEGLTLEQYVAIITKIRHSKIEFSSAHIGQINCRNKPIDNL